MLGALLDLLNLLQRLRDQRKFLLPLIRQRFLYDLLPVELLFLLVVSHELVDGVVDLILHLTRVPLLVVLLEPYLLLGDLLLNCSWLRFWVLAGVRVDDPSLDALLPGALQLIRDQLLVGLLVVLDQVRIDW